MPGRLALNFHRRKEWTSAAKRASLSPCRDKGRLAPSGILPRWRWCHCGASVVTVPGAVATEKDPQAALATSLAEGKNRPLLRARERHEESGKAF
jgi:hypothetical protein